MSRTFIDIHVLQTVPPANLNRDDTGSPKTATYGGVQRARVSSQAWKRATRVMFREQLDPRALGVRTKRVVELVVERVGELLEERGEQSVSTAAQGVSAAAVVRATGLGLEKARKKKAAEEDTSELEQSKYLVFLSATQIDRLAALAIEHAATGKVDKAAAKAAAKGGDSIDVALFGRMVAEAADLNVDAAAQVAHALSVHEVNTEFDYYTAVDDRAPEDNAGAGMIGVVEFNSATLYRYATINTPMLRENLGDNEATAAAVEHFLNAFVRSMPTGKQNTFANRTLPDAVVISIRSDQPVNLVTAFQEPVRGVGVDRASGAAKALVERFCSLQSAFGGDTPRTYVVIAGEGMDALSALPGAEVNSFPTVIEQVVDAIRADFGRDS